MKRQAALVESSCPAILAHQLEGARFYHGVYYRDASSGDWAETDAVILIEDVLFVIEAKAGAMPMHSPATNFASRKRIIHELIVAAYLQCKRFLSYLASASEVPLYDLRDGLYVETTRVSLAKFRLVLPIGLTVESFTPFSSIAKTFPEVQPLLGQYPFVSMSVDDLFVINRFLPTTGELLHYLEVRQSVAALPNAMPFDEIEHLGAYISKNRFDLNLREQLEEQDLVVWASFGEVVDRYFEGPDWDSKPMPTQPYPGEFSAILKALDRLRPVGWLRLDAFLRDYSEEGRANVARFLADLIPTLAVYPSRRFQVGEDRPLQIWLCRQGAQPSWTEMLHQAEIGCLVVSAAEMQVLMVIYGAAGEVTLMKCESFRAPITIQSNYELLLAEAGRQRERIVVLH